MTAIPNASQAQVSEIKFTQLQFQVEVDKHKQSQRAYQKLVSMNNQLDTQLNENGMVKEELDLIKKDDAVVYKLQGPVLVRQSLVEAKENVERRIKYIESELEKNKELLKQAREKLGEERALISKLEENIQKMVHAAGITFS